MNGGCVLAGRAGSDRQRVEYPESMATADSGNSGQPLLVLGKIGEILDAFSLERPSLTLGEIRESTGFPTSTVQRLVTNMVSLGFLDRQGDQVRVGVKMAYWAAPAVKGVDVLDLIVPVLKQLRDETGETASFFRAEQGHRVCVALAETAHALRREMHVGTIMPLHAGSAGRVLLAWDEALAKSVLSQPLGPITDSTITSADELAAVIRQTRADGYAITIGEREQGASGLSAPVFKANGELAGCLTISGPTIRMPLDRCLDWLDLLVESAEQSTRLLGGRFPTTSSIAI
jgi:DNA-binding IclR family transcriptional regulator